MALEARIASLATMTPVALREEWERMYRAPPPAGYGPDLLARAMAYSIQEKISGGLPSRIVREIRGGVLEIAAASLSTDRPPPLRPGTRLTREWHGKTHHVHVVDGGFDYADQRYRSFTAIAREITGAAWSGPRFFGLAGRRGT